MYCSFLKKWFDIVLFIYYILCICDTHCVCVYSISIDEDLSNQLSRNHSFPGKLALEKKYIC